VENFEVEVDSKCTKRSPNSYGLQLYEKERGGGYLTIDKVVSFNICFYLLLSFGNCSQ
jgi:hypothetical protein